MTIRGTSNQTIKTTARTIRSQSVEVGPNDEGGGSGFPQAGSVEYRESDNNPGSGGMMWTSGSHHLAWGVPQADRQP